MTTETLPEVRPAPAEPTTPIRPSEAIRLGCLIAPVQSFKWAGEIPTACAVHALGLGRGKVEDLDGQPPNCPDCGRDYYEKVSYTVVHLNDDHRWSRERIADWLEGLGL